jgi:WD40 repeat protein
MSHRVSRLTGYGATGLHEPIRAYMRREDDIYVYDVSTTELVATFSTISAGAATDIDPRPGIEISPDNRFILTQGTNGTGAYDINDGTELYFLSNASHSRPAISKDGAYIALAEGNGANTKIVETSGWTQDASFDPVMTGREVYAWSHDGTKLAISDISSQVRIFETSGYTAYSNLISIGDDAVAMAFSPDDTLLACSTKELGGSLALDVMTVATTMTSGSAHSDAMNGVNGTGVAFSPDGSILYASCLSNSDAGIESFNTSSWASIDTASSADLGSDAVTEISISSTGSYILVGQESGVFQLFDDKLNLIKLIADLSTVNLGGVAFEFPR